MLGASLLWKAAFFMLQPPSKKSLNFFKASLQCKLYTKTFFYANCLLTLS